MDSTTTSVSSVIYFAEPSNPPFPYNSPADMVLEGVMEFDYNNGNRTKLSKILLNGNNICMLIPGGEGPGQAA